MRHHHCEFDPIPRRLGRPIFGYSNCATRFAERSRKHVEAMPDPHPGLVVHGFGLPDNLMIPSAVLRGGGRPMVVPLDGKDRAFNALDVFQCCVAAAAQTVTRPTATD